MSEYEAKVIRTPLGIYRAQVLLDGRVVGTAPMFALGSATREGALEAAKRVAELHRDNSRPAVKLGVPK